MNTISIKLLFLFKSKIVVNKLVTASALEDDAVVFQYAVIIYDAAVY